MIAQRNAGTNDVAPAMPRRDTGFGLVEVLVAVVLIAMAVVPLMMAGVVSIKVSGRTNVVSKTETVLANAADRVNRAGEGCDYGVYAEAAALAQGWTADRVAVNYAYFVPDEPAANASGSPVTAGHWEAGACPGTQRPEGLVQKVTISVHSPDDTVTRSIVVVKSDV